MAPDLLAGAGIRTKSATAPRFHPGAYHNGTTWPMDSGVISDGLRRHGYLHQADDLDERIVRACVDVGGFPEFFRGDLDGAIRVNTEIVEISEPDGRINRLEQPPQRIQGWTVTRVWRILRRRGAMKRTGVQH
jgi:glycogen debranching enzyme